MYLKWSSFWLSLLIVTHGFATAVIDQKTQVDLDLVHTDKKTLGQVVSNAITVSGRARLDNFLLNPTTSIDVLKHRQQFIAYLHDNDTLHSSLKKFLGQLVEHESFLHEQGPKDPLVDKALERVYFSLPVLKRFNTSAYALVFGYATHILGICAPLVEHIALHMGIDILASHEHCSHGGHGHSHGHKKDKKEKHNHAHVSNLSYYGVQFLHWGLHIPGLYDMGADIWHRALMMKHLQDEMIHVATYVKKAKTIYALLQQHAIDRSTLEAYGTLDDFFGSSLACSDACQQLLQLLERSTFTGQACVFNNVGNVLAAYNAYRESRDELVLLAQAVGEVDVWVGAAERIKNSTLSDAWCFATYAVDTLPSIMANNVRHLFIAKEKVRGWDISTKNGAHTFITGDNGVGKSTYLNGTGHAIILAQTLGIVPAAHFELTPFAHICTYRFIEDDIFEGMSRFYAECARVDSILKVAKNSDGFCCVLLDEPFTSTHRERGRQYLKEALSQLFGMQHVVSFTTTHYGSLTTILDEPQNVLSVHLS